MIFVDNEKITDPRINLAIEEYLLQSDAVDDDILFFYINEPSIIIGRFQNTHEEINRDYVDEHNLHVVRRLSGGGAVYHDLGNLNYSLITRGGLEEATNFKKFTAPVIKALQKLGIPAELSGRNDICVEERKISGNAIFSKPRGTVCHGTLLFNTDLTQLSKALNVKPEKINSKGVKSVRSRVANISEYLQTGLDVESLRMHILKTIFEGQEPIPQYHLTSADWEAIHKISAERYQTWEWNYGKNPLFNIEKTLRFPFGHVDARIQVENGRIQNIKFFGDFFGSREIEELEKGLLNVRYERNALNEALESMPVGAYIGGMEKEALAAFLF